MINVLSILIHSLERICKIEENSQPLTKENAYAIYSTGKKMPMEKVLERCKKDILDYIKSSASFKNTNCLIRLDSYLSDENKENIIAYLRSLGYDILFSNEDVILISWK